MGNTSSVSPLAIHRVARVNKYLELDLGQSLKFDKIYILDYKPEADKVHPESQLYLYARALNLQTKIPLSNFRCAWFDNKSYFEFDPSLRIKNS